MANLKIRLLIRPNGAMPPITVKDQEKQRGGFAVPEFYPALHHYLKNNTISNLDFTNAKADARRRMRDFVKRAFWDEIADNSPAGVSYSERKRWHFIDGTDEHEDSCFNPATGDWDDRTSDECTNLIILYQPVGKAPSPDHRPFRDAEGQRFVLQYFLNISVDKHIAKRCAPAVDDPAEALTHPACPSNP